MTHQPGNNPLDVEERSLRSLFTRAFGKSRPGSPNLSNLSIYAFGLSGVWTGIGAGILPFKVIEALELGDISILGYALDKNGALGLISLLGLIVAAAAQLAAGSLSDRDKRPGKRLLYLLIGGIGLGVMTILFGLTSSFLTLILAIVGMQFFGNSAQGPANALIIDHVPVNERGAAAGVLNLWRLLGAGSITVVVLQFMARYDKEDSPEWLWYSIALMTVAVVITVLWTVITNRPQDGWFIPTLKKKTLNTVDSPELVAETAAASRSGISRSYLAFLVALAFGIAAMSSMQIYALFFLQDVVGLDNPADGADWLVVAIVAAAALTVLPAGRLADRWGRTSLFILAGAAGVVSSLLLLFVSSIGPVLAIGFVIGISVGLFMTLTWAVANDLVSRSAAAKELGYTSVATLIGAAGARFAGVGIDELNDVSENLGYKMILVSVAISFALSALILAKIAKDSSFTESTHPSDPIAMLSASD
ncbi:MAG: MFS transporter [Chloroflexi bacterium]|nr:MFS transporter [Chloroflexota bacterium]MDA1282276.1 MFS transporter [Chloroflexota bacterium]